MTQTSKSVDYRIAIRDDETYILDVLAEVAAEIPAPIDASDTKDPIRGEIIRCRESGKSWVAVADGKIVGVVLARKDIHDQQAITLPYIGVSPDYRGRKIFSTLLDKLKADGAPLTGTVLLSNKSGMADQFTEVSRDDKQIKLRWEKPKPKTG
jgi:ribosomal protein S18 acetylase RimI-like enzyme